MRPILYPIWSMNDQKGGVGRNQPVTFTGMNFTTSELLIGVHRGGFDPCHG